MLSSAFPAGLPSFFLFLLLSSSASAFPVTHSLEPIRATIQRVGDNFTVFDPVTQLPIPQGPATDAGGNGFSASAVLWVIFTFVAGIYLSFFGVRTPRVTASSGMALASAVVVWAAFVNTIPANGLTLVQTPSASAQMWSDVILTVIVLGAFGFGFGIGFLKISRPIGMGFMSAVGGMAFVLHGVLIRDNLLVHVYAVNIILVGLGLLANLILTIFRPRWGMLLATTSSGVFLLILAIDLVSNTQSGISRGLRFFFDRNSAHIVDLRIAGYNPPLSSKILLAASYPLIPMLFYAQHKLYPTAFLPSNEEVTIRFPRTKPFMNKVGFGVALRTRQEPSRFSV